MIEHTEQIINRLFELGDQGMASHAQGFFKTGKSGYGEGDRFLGIRVPTLRKVARDYRELPLETTLELLRNPFHEARLLALFLLVARYPKSGITEKIAIYDAYLSHTGYINNWDLVDCSAEHIVGTHLFARSRRPLYRLVRSKSLWERRISVIATFYFIKRSDFRDILALAESLLHDREDLIHKAVGWMLREVGKRNRTTEQEFLAKHYRKMPRTMLRYAIEKFPESERQAYLRGTQE
jgi:3-methyladenine DNA glycosylase AlkD